MGHLLRRAGFGANQKELDQFLSMGLPATIDYLIEYEAVDDSALEAKLSSLNLNPDRLADLQRWWLLRMLYTKRPLQEKMVLFWHGLLTSAFSKVGQGPHMYNQNQLFRSNALSRYDVLLKAVSRDPAMLIWLDSRSNIKAAPNENFARELMELFTTGIGHYTETDVRESARAFTGWGLRQNAFSFNPAQHDTGAKTFLGKTGNFDGDDIIDIIMQQPATAEFISRKLFSFFAYDHPEPAIISSLARTFRESNYSIKAVVRQILSSPAFYSPKAYRAKIKSPAELVAGTVRTLGLETDGIILRGVTDRMGQTLFNPFDVSGWAGGATWINSTTLIERFNFMNRMATARGRALELNLRSMLIPQLIFAPADALEYFVALLLDGNMPSQEKDILLAFLKGLDSLPLPAGTRSPTEDEKSRSLLYLVLASPDYQLA